MFELTKSLKVSALLLTALVTGCSPESKSEATVLEEPKPTIADTVINLSPENGLCAEEGTEVNLAALLEKDCRRLSSYRLFMDAQNPTANGNDRVLPYDLSTALFTDYATKYRFVYVPDGQVAQFDEAEVMNLPVGSVLIKTFALPANTNQRGFENERLVETRLLIHRENGWTALPYIWTKDGRDAALKVAGGNFNVSLEHDNNDLAFVYQVPDKNKCKQCHQIDKTTASGDTESIFSPIGPKARFLNTTFDYSSGKENQLVQWQNEGLLTGVPADLSGIDSVPVFDDSDAASLAELPFNELETLAKGYLDINCAHCHRKAGGNASNTGLSYEFWRPYAGNEKAHGRCKTPIAFSDEVNNERPYGLKPGSADESLMVYRMETLQPGHRMPEIGRMTTHTEGVALIKQWINAMPAEQCTS